MTRTRVALVGLGGALVATWLFAAVGTRQPTVAAPSSPVESSDADALAAAVRAQAERLHARLARAPEPRGSDRNPFVFGADAVRKAPPEVAAAASGLAPAAAVESARPGARLELVAIVTEGSERRAVLSVTDDVAIVGVGDVVAGRYRVTAVSADVVELADVRGAPARRLGLR
jgi:hypothetical protein